MRLRDITVAARCVRTTPHFACIVHAGMAMLFDAQESSPEVVAAGLGQYPSYADLYGATWTISTESGFDVYALHGNSVPQASVKHM